MKESKQLAKLYEIKNELENERRLILSKIFSIDKFILEIKGNETRARSLEEIKERLKFMEDTNVGSRVNTPMGNGTVESIIEDLMCHVNVLLDHGGISRNFLMDELYYER